MTPIRHLLALALLSGACEPTPEPTKAPPDAPTVSSQPSAQPSSEPNEVGESRAMVGRFAAALKQELMQGMNAGGPVNAIAVCSERAPKIAAELDVKQGWSIRRTSLKLRNPDNAPDEWERRVLERFERDKAGGASVDALELHEIVDSGGAREFRFMKAIPTQGMCLSCHGASIADDVRAALDARYPDDAARGFDEGDIRGAFSLRKRL